MSHGGMDRLIAAVRLDDGTRVIVAIGRRGLDYRPTICSVDTATTVGHAQELLAKVTGETAIRLLLL